MWRLKYLIIGMLPAAVLGVILYFLAPQMADALRDAVRAALGVADARTPHQDPEFAVQQLTEMAVRALSPGTNDPYTAMNALDDLSVGLARLAGRPRPTALRRDDAGEPRVHARERLDPPLHPLLVVEPGHDPGHRHLLAPPQRGAEVGLVGDQAGGLSQRLHGFVMPPPLEVLEPRLVERARRSVRRRRPFCVTESFGKFRDRCR